MALTAGATLFCDGFIESILDPLKLGQIRYTINFRSDLYHRYESFGPETSIVWDADFAQNVVKKAQPGKSSCKSYRLPRWHFAKLLVALLGEAGGCISSFASFRKLSRDFVNKTTIHQQQVYIFNFRFHYFLL